jgi:hypothetical protein
MSKESFSRLCRQICDTVGEDVFRSETYLDCANPISQLQSAHEVLGGYILGEVKLAMTIRMLAGASYLDLMCAYNVH